MRRLAPPQPAVGRALLIVGLAMLPWGRVVAAAPVCKVGVARVDITPTHPVRLSGYGARRAESEGVAQRLWAKALAISGEGADPAVLIAVDNCGVPAGVTEEVAERLTARHGLRRERFVVCSTHTHTGPCVSGFLPALFAAPIPQDHRQHIERYTQCLVDALEQVAGAALDDLRPGYLAWAQGRVGFAMNRRVMKSGRCTGIGVNPDGPVDHAMPLLSVRDEAGRIRAVLVTYACHCTTLGSDFNQICGDWAGCAQEYIEQDWPGATCLVTIGCGADANPQPRLSIENARRHGRAIADEARRLLSGRLSPVTGTPICRLERIRLPFDTPPGREEWKKRATTTGPAGYHARSQLERLDRGEALRTHLSYPVQSWAFGDAPVMLFLAGEVVVDYALQFKREFGAARLWVTSYANDVPCYIPSRRVLAEGGYESEQSMLYYDQPARLAPEVEELIGGAVRRSVPTMQGAGTARSAEQDDVAASGSISDGRRRP